MVGQNTSQRNTELTVESECVLWGFRVIVPEVLRSQMLTELHHNHQGIVKMKALARSHFWWPNLDADIEVLVSTCQTCQTERNQPVIAPVHNWSWPNRPWQRIHVDFAQKGKYNFLVVTDSFSRWPEIALTSSSTAGKTIEVLRGYFANWGLPDELISDNVPQFVASEFQTFLKNNGVKHIRSPAYHPASNGAAERLVQNFKRALEKGKNDNLSLQHCIHNFLFCYRSTPQSTTGKNPSRVIHKARIQNQNVTLET